MNNSQRVGLGRAAMRIGAVDSGNLDPEDVQWIASDTISNVLHALAEAGGDTDAALRTATSNFDREREEV